MVDINKKLLLIIILIVTAGGILRLYNLGQTPPALHGDELGIGYNAYSLIKLGVDEYGFKFPFVFRNDFSPLIHYLTIPSIYIFGLNEFSTRLPSSIIGTLSIIAVYLLTLILYKNQKLALLTSFLFAVSSWHIRTSRIAVEMTWALFFQICATTLFISSQNSKKKIILLLSFLLFSLSILSYQTAKLTTPLLVIFLIFRFSRKSTISKYLFPYLIFIILPIIVYFTQRPLFEMRFIGISIFTVWRSIPNHNLSQLVLMITENYIKHFNPKILFMDNSFLRYYQTKNIGLIYFWELLSIIPGIWILLKNINKKENQLVLFLFLISPIAASLTTGIPNANIGRSLMLLPVFELLAATGILHITRLIKKFRYFKTMHVYVVFIALIATLTLGFFLHQYFVDMPKRYADFWGVPIKNAVKQVIPEENNFDRIIFTTTISPQTYMYVLFYGKKEPKWLQENKGERNQMIGFSSFGKYEFRKINWESDKKIPNAMLIGTPEEIPVTNGNTKLRIYKTNN